MYALTFRYAQPEDCGLILGFIQALAEYEGMLEEVVATEPLLREWIFEKKKAEVLFACEDGREDVYKRQVEYHRTKQFGHTRHVSTLL